MGPNASAHRKVPAVYVPRVNLQVGDEIPGRKLQVGDKIPGGQAKPDAIALQEPRAHQRVENPRHWLEVPANHLEDAEVVAKEKGAGKGADGRGHNVTSKNKRTHVPTDEGVGPPCSAIAEGVCKPGLPG